MTQGDRRRDLLRTLVYHGFQRDRSETTRLRFVGEIEVVGRKIGVALSFLDTEFTTLPVATLLAPELEAPHVVAHLTGAGVLCFARNEDIVLDRYNVGRTTLLCLELTKRGLERALTHKRLEAEIAAEFPQHWDGFSCYYDFKRDTGSSTKLYSIDRPGGLSVPIITNSVNTITKLVSDEDLRKKVLKQGQEVFRLEADRPLTFLPGYRAPKTLAEFLDWVETMAPGNRSRVVEGIVSAYPNTKPVFVYSSNGCVGFHIEIPVALAKRLQRKQGLRLLIEKASAVVTRYGGSRIDDGFIFGRNLMKQTPLLGKRIILIGCGTIGSHLASLLVHSGAGQQGGALMMVDNQALEPGNVGRHYLGTAHIGERKTVGMKSELLKAFPDATITAVSKNALDYLDELTNYDLVVDATGEEALSVSINDHLVRQRQAGSKTAAVHVWLFGNGAAAQALLVDSANFACFKCLKPDHGGRWRFDPMKTGQAAITAATACGDAAYTPYGIAAPVIAAALALQVILEWNTGEVQHRLRTSRIERSSTNEVRDTNPSKSERCPACALVENV